MNRNRKTSTQTNTVSEKLKSANNQSVPNLYEVYRPINNRYSRQTHDDDQQINVISPSGDQNYQGNILDPSVAKTTSNSSGPYMPISELAHNQLLHVNDPEHSILHTINSNMSGKNNNPEYIPIQNNMSNMPVYYETPGRINSSMPIESHISASGIPSPPILQDVNPILREVNPILREVKPIIQEVNPITHEVNPILREVNPITHEVNPITHEVNPITQEVNPIIQDVAITNSYICKDKISNYSLVDTNIKQYSLIHYHIIGGKGWQRIYGYLRGTDIQPIVVIKNSTLYGITISHSGIGPIQPGKVYLYKNIKANTITQENDYIISIIKIKDVISTAINFTLLPGEDNEYASWECIPKNESLVKIIRNDRISLYAENLSGVNIELYFES